jgi:hypothetical protein
MGPPVALPASTARLDASQETRIPEGRNLRPRQKLLGAEEDLDDVAILNLILLALCAQLA